MTEKNHKAGYRSGINYDPEHQIARNRKGGPKKRNVNASADGPQHAEKCDSDDR